MNISGVVVRTLPERIEEVINSLEESGLCDVHFHDDKGRIIVTIEAETTEEEVFKLKALQGLEHVLSADLVYAYSEEELEKAKEELHMERGELPKIVEEDVPAERIKYYGHIYKDYE
ncbi:periplasmic nitrate reductase chaperone NapD [Hydrogenivirga caldilitoris]|uniref:Chaperone NapD n=1 Tax=Hydrogenivirga caldilitoris TaxID=246264 RepID=A0A497XRN9_9AQUI|nr:chaperone NapD [Hydrogenivirga caldilitoris]RLJ70820.1 periplasmic nitrate reductase chaperone NapD [Hydrogenivirga caldilitoris]